jgi:hypothetical protein
MANLYSIRCAKARQGLELELCLAREQNPCRFLSSHMPSYSIAVKPLCPASHNCPVPCQWSRLPQFLAPLSPPHIRIVRDRRRQRRTYVSYFNSCPEIDHLPAFSGEPESCGVDIAGDRRNIPTSTPRLTSRVEILSLSRFLEKMASFVHLDLSITPKHSSGHPVLGATSKSERVEE